MSNFIPAPEEPVPEFVESLSEGGRDDIAGAVVQYGAVVDDIAGAVVQYSSVVDDTAGRVVQCSAVQY